MSPARLSWRGAAMVLCLLLSPVWTHAQEAPVEESLAPGFAVPQMDATFAIPEPVAPNVPWLQHIKDAARAYGVDAHLLQAVVKVESNFDTFAVSRAGAVGLMQIMPATAAGVAGLRGTPQSLKQQLHDPAINIHAGAMYLRSLLDTFAHRVDLALAAYNAGTGNVRKSGNRVPQNGETPQFVAKVLGHYNTIKAKALLPNASEISGSN
jgi:soluble lytic murein transglycosylase-like protein